MALNLLFCLDLSDWEERLAAAYYLAKEEPVGALESTTLGRITAVLAEVKALPTAWGRELCLETLLSNKRPA